MVLFPERLVKILKEALTYELLVELLFIKELASYNKVLITTTLLVEFWIKKSVADEFEVVPVWFT